MEIVSPESVTRDRRDDFREYALAGVGEHWIVDPLSRAVETFAHRGTGQVPIPESEGRLASRVVPGWCLRPEWLWADPRPSVLRALEEIGVRPA